MCCSQVLPLLTFDPRDPQTSVLMLNAKRLNLVRKIIEFLSTDHTCGIKTEPRSNEISHRHLKTRSHQDVTFMEDGGRKALEMFLYALAFSSVCR